MKASFLFLFTFFICLASTRAAFPVTQASQSASENQQIPASERLKPVSYDPGNKKPRHHSHRYYEDRLPGWPGIVAIASCLLIPFGGWLPALIFGGIGLNPKYRNRGLAIAAIALSCAYFLVLIIFFLMLLGVFS